MRDKVNEGRDFVLVSVELIKFFSEKYEIEGGTFEEYGRCAKLADDGKIIIEKRLRKIRLLPFPFDECNTTDPFTCYVPASFTVTELEHKCRRLLNDHFNSVGIVTTVEEFQLWKSNTFDIDVIKGWDKDYSKGINAEHINKTAEDKSRKLGNLDFLDDTIFCVETPRAT